jgi:cGMP-dependent protein kinase
MKPCTAHRNSYIFKQGDKSGAYYIILEGVCQVEINGEKKRTLAYGDSFGDLGIIYNAPRSASVLAVTDCELAEINRKMFKKVMDDINQLYEKETKKFLQVLTFFKDLTEDQKNAIASCCLT